VSRFLRSVPIVNSFRNVPGCGFTMPRKRQVFSFAPSVVSRDDCEPEKAYGLILGVGAREKGKGKSCPSCG
jgi:hypothetical protein